MEPGHLGEQAQVPASDQDVGAGEQPHRPPRARVLQAAAVAAYGHAHLAVPGADAEFREQAHQVRVGALVVHQESGVQRHRPPVPVEGLLGVGVAAEPVVGLEQLDLHPGPGEPVRRGEPGDAGSHHRHRARTRAGAWGRGGRAGARNGGGRAGARDRRGGDGVEHGHEFPSRPGRGAARDVVAPVLRNRARTGLAPTRPPRRPERTQRCRIVCASAGTSGQRPAPCSARKARTLRQESAHAAAVSAEPCSKKPCGAPG